MANTAFEAITTRQSWYAASALAKYYACMIDTAGLIAKSDGSRPFVGIVEYGAAAKDDMVTVVKGSYPALATEEIHVGDLLTIDGGTPGKFKIADTSNDIIYGVALTAAAAGDLFTIMMNDVTLSVA